MKEFFYKALLDINKLDPEVTLFCMNYQSGNLVAIQDNSRTLFLRGFGTLLRKKFQGHKYFILYPSDLELIKSEFLYYINNSNTSSMRFTKNGFQNYCVTEVINEGNLDHMITERGRVHVFKYKGLVTLLKLTSKKYNRLFKSILASSK